MRIFSSALMCLVLLAACSSSDEREEVVLQSEAPAAAVFDLTVEPLGEDMFVEAAPRQETLTPISEGPVTYEPIQSSVQAKPVHKSTSHGGVEGYWVNDNVEVFLFE